MSSSLENFGSDAGKTRKADRPSRLIGADTLSNTIFASAEMVEPNGIEPLT
jgi:hypothetical protein